MVAALGRNAAQSLNQNLNEAIPILLCLESEVNSEWRGATSDLLLGLRVWAYLPSSLLDVDVAVTSRG